MVFPKKERTPLGFCDGLDKIFVGFGDKDERGCRAPKYHTNYAPFYPIHKAASTGNTDTLKTFIKQGAFFMEQVDWKCRTALHFACVYGRPEVVALLMENSCDISPKDIKGATPLIKAVQCRQTKCLDILLKYGAGPDLKDCCDNTALHYAVYNGDVETAAKLLEHQANTEVRNENKLTPLLLALKQNKEKMAEFLINNGANIKPCDFLGSMTVVGGSSSLAWKYRPPWMFPMTVTPLRQDQEDCSLKKYRPLQNTLMYAVRCGSELIIKLLLQRGIDPSKQDVFGWTAERYAVESKSKVKTLLINYPEEELRQTCSKPGLQVSSEKKSKKCDHTKSNRLSKFFQRVFRGSHSSGTREEKGEDIPKGRVLAWTKKDDLSKPRTKKKKASTDEVEVIMLKSFKSDLSLEVVIEESLEEEQKGDDDDDNDDDGNGIAHPQHLEEETELTAGESGQGSPSRRQMNTDSLRYAMGKNSSIDKFENMPEKCFMCK